MTGSGEYFKRIMVQVSTFDMRLTRVAVKFAYSKKYIEGLPVILNKKCLQKSG